MAVPIALRADFTADQLRQEARRSRNAGQALRLLALATIYDGGSRGDAARAGSVTLQIVRDWVVRFNVKGPAGLIDSKAAGPAFKLNDARRRALAAMVQTGPDPAVHGVVRWRLIDLAQWLWEAFRVSLYEDTVGRELRKLGYRKLSARPRHHAQDPGSLTAFKKRPGRSGGDRPGRRRRQAHRGLVSGRGQDPPEERHRPPLGGARQPSRGAPRSAHRLGLSVRGDLPRRGQGCRARAATMHHCSDEPASGRDRHPVAADACRPAAGSGGMAHEPPRRRPIQHHPTAVTGARARAQPGRERLEVHAPELAFEQGFHLRPRHRRPLLSRLEQARRSALAHHVHRATRLGACVMINADW